MRQIFQIPSQLVAERVGIARWLTFLLIAWGVVATCFAGLTSSHVHLYILRFLLGDYFCSLVEVVLTPEANAKK